MCVMSAARVSLTDHCFLKKIIWVLTFFSFFLDAFFFYIFHNKNEMLSRTIELMFVSLLTSVL